MSKKVYVTIMLFLSLITAGILFIVALAIFPLRVIDVVEPMPVLAGEYHPGDEIQFVVDYCKFVEARAVSSKRLVNDFIYSYPETSITLGKGCGVFVSSSTKIPEYAEPGTYHVELTITYELNPFHTYTKTLRSEEFKVVGE